MSHEIFDRKVDGMICPQCEDEIAHRLLHTRGILSCTASYRKSTVTADFDPDILSADDIGRILAETGYPVGDGRSGRRADAIALVLVATVGGNIPLVVAALVGGSTFGDVTSPLSDIVIESAMGAGVDTIDLGKAQLLPRVILALITTVLYVIFGAMAG